MNVAQAVIPHMVARKYGRVIFTSGGMGLPGLATYGAAKAGVEALTHSVAAEVTSSGVIVNGIGPGLGLTGLTKGADVNSPHLRGFIQSSMLKDCVHQKMWRLWWPFLLRCLQLSDRAVYHETS
jgi:NAD(P)-dependent dehydrogenase (short-subunit alcohol dehydrogenase family)